MSLSMNNPLEHIRDCCCELETGKPIMRRREVVSLLVAASVMVPRAAHAQKTPAKVYRLGLLQPGAPPEPLVDALTERLHELGYREGNNIVYEYRWAEGKLNLLPELAKELVDLKVDVIATFSTPLQLLRKKQPRPFLWF